ncbi:von Willebrand factor A domain-containing protein 7-like isoform X2 [Haliotis rufescens]|uniref:von Willebrand factor A domain-containing protein 7-like isoform X2 n=1 Tax=Haliotis rufescens TaxID=6454 RepID=UPI00201EB803|nr:von Willebrand factor A domain-containing protein 7-like isoform X2 [Haliotis rufescens]
MAISPLLLLLAVLVNIDAFFPNRLTSTKLGNGTLTHKDITEIGILQAVAGYFEDNPRDGSLIQAGELRGIEGITALKLFQRYYGDGVSGSRLQAAINNIVTANNLVYLDHLHEAVWHCSGETIKEAHEKMAGLRDHAIQLLKRDNANFDSARQLIGQFLHVMQMFYSNSNWVEMFGADPYYELGIRGKPLYAQAPQAMATCRSCGNQMTSCDNTLIVGHSILTSGYRSGQDIKKPYRDPSTTQLGKCSHGGRRDASGNDSAALGGINKDSILASLSPHHSLHEMAAQAAINHTAYFFLDQDYGLRAVIGKEKYEQFLQLKSGNSMIFTIDTTGSMSNDIAAVKAQVRDIIQTAVGTTDEPANYIVSLFNDPVNMTTVFQSGNSTETLIYIQSIRVHGGGDCPEYILDGIEKALSVCNPDSQMYVFTDASAKDFNRVDRILTLLDQKKVKIDFLLTSDCSRRRRETEGVKETLRIRRSASGEDLYRSLAEATGGTVYVTDKTAIHRVAAVIRESAKASSVTILKKTVPSSETLNISVPVDSTVERLTIMIISSGEARETIYNPQGTIQTTHQHNYTVENLSSSIKMIKIDFPQAGGWRVVRQDSNSWEVEVTGQSTLDISTTFVKLDHSTGFEYEIRGRPIAGKNTTLVLSVSSADLIATLDTIHLLDSDGSESAQYDSLRRIPGRDGIAEYRLQFPLPDQGFRVSVSGNDVLGNRYTRLQARSIIPVAIQLHVLPLNGSLYVREELTLVFVVTNKGDVTTNITVSVEDDQGFAQAPHALNYVMSPNQNVSGDLRLVAGATEGVTSTVTISAKSTSGRGDNFQYEVKHISTERHVTRPVDNVHPVCHVTSVSGQCNVTTLDPCVCRQYTWTGTAEIWDEGFGLYLLSASEKTFLVYDPFLVGQTRNNGSIHASVRGDCCHPVSYITVVDLASNTGLCVFDLLPGWNGSLHRCETTPSTAITTSTTAKSIKWVAPETTGLLSHKEIVIAASVGGCVIFVVMVVAAVVIYRRKAPENMYAVDGSSRRS